VSIKAANEANYPSWVLKPHYFFIFNACYLMSTLFIKKFSTSSVDLKEVIKACDIVPTHNISKFWDAYIFEVPMNPPIKAYWAADKAPSGPWALLVPNYRHFFGWTAFTIRLAFVATNDANPIRLSKGVYNNWIKLSGPVYVIKG
jgi:hypothetical protein